VANAGERHRVAPLAVAQAPLGRVPEERHLDRGAKLQLLERLQEVAVGLGDAGAPERVVVGVGGEVDDWDVPPIADDLRRLDAVDAALDADVHEDEVGLELAGHGDRLLAARRHADDGVADPVELEPEVASDETRILDDQDACAHHAPGLAWSPPSASKSMVKVVPRSRPMATVPWSCSTRSCTSCRPSDPSRPRSNAVGRLTPSSRTVRVQWRPSGELRSTNTRPDRPSGKACLKALATSSL